MPSSKLRNKHKSDIQVTKAYQFSFEAIGTQWSISFTATISQPQFEGLQKTICQRIDLFDKHYSRFRADSLITTMSQSAGMYHLPDDAKPLFDLYQKLYELTDGAMTPLIGQLLSAAGYDAAYSLRAVTLPVTPSWDQVLNYTFPNLIVKQPVLLDVGAAGKGYLVDIIGQLIEHAGIANFSINAGGDILQRQISDEAEPIGLEHPGNYEQLVGVAHIANQSICGSAGNRRAWGAYHHIINPKNQSSPNHVRATWVIADSTLIADGLSTALFFVRHSPTEQLLQF